MDRHTVASPLHRLLDSSAHLGPEYGAGLSSHLPMALCALDALGADAARLQQFFDGAARRFAPPRRPAAATSALADWRVHRGDLDHFDTLAGHFRLLLAHQGRDAVLRGVLPDLMTGVAAAAFHGLIRTAYAVGANHSAELASALAYWACRWSPLPGPHDALAEAAAGPSARLAFDEWALALLTVPVSPRAEGRLISDRLRGLVKTNAYAALAGRLAIDGDTLSRLAALAVERYVASRHFTVLHLVTATHAMRVIRPWLDDPDSALGHFADAFAAVYLSCGLDPQSPVLPTPGWSWPEVIARAIQSDDEHVIKLVHSCREEALVHGDGRYLQAAGLVVG